VRARTADLAASLAELEHEVAERQRAEAALRQSGRLAAVGTLAAGIAHEINNPVAGILTAAELARALLRDGAPAAQLEEVLESIIGGAKRCGGIVRSVLQFARGEQHTERVPHELNDVVRRALALVRGEAARAGTHVGYDLAPGLPLVVMDTTEMTQTLTNLLHNAVQARATRVLVRTWHADACVHLAIEDDGCGIAAADLDRIFDPFFTTRREQGGTGLGLSIVHGIVTKHGGTVDVASAVGRGTTVTLALPLA
jgi:two-component system NtrC family sensor kinase